MDSNFREMKISLYKRQIFKQFTSCNILDIYHGEELSRYNTLNKKVSFLDSVKREIFCYYNPSTHQYLDINTIYSEALSYFTKNLNISKEDGVVLFFIEFQNEYFGLKTILSENLNSIIQILNNKELLIITENLDKLATLYILEYDIEVLFFDKQQPLVDNSKD